MSQLDDNLAALVEYFNSTKAVTSKAAKIKDQFATWYSNLGWYSKTVNSDDTWNQARNYRDQFNLANTTTSAQQQAVIDSQSHGLTTEQMQGNPAQARLSSGLYAASDPNPLIPNEYKFAAVVVTVGVILIAAYGISMSAPVALAGYAASRRRRMFE
jgi:hypothetical protein